MAAVNEVIIPKSVISIGAIAFGHTTLFGLSFEGNRTEQLIVIKDTFKNTTLTNPNVSVPTNIVIDTNAFDGSNAVINYV